MYDEKEVEDVVCLFLLFFFSPKKEFKVSASYKFWENRFAVQGWKVLQVRSGYKTTESESVFKTFNC